MEAAPENGQLHPAVGRDIRRLRKRKGITIKELAAATGRSVGFLSQIERGLSEIALSDLQHITQRLGVPLGWFFVNEPGPPSERDFVVRAGRRRPVGSREGGLIEELLSPDLGGSHEVFRSVFEPRAEMHEAQRRDTEETGYVVSGELELWLDDRRLHLHEGDSFRFAGQAYRWRNPTDRETVAIWVIAPPVY